MSNPNVLSFWQNRELLIKHLASHANKGRLTFLIGAGLSKNLGLPDWNELLVRLYAYADKGTPTADVTQAGEYLQTSVYAEEPLLFRTALRDCLYRSVAERESALYLENPYLGALCSLLMRMALAGGAKIITLNYDDILETYLSTRGFRVRTLFEDWWWSQANDVEIYHPNGFLPQNDSLASSDSFIFGESSFFDRINDPNSSWNHVLLSILRSRTCIWLGVSGDDLTIRAMLRLLKTQHAIRRTRIKFHSVKIEMQGKQSTELTRNLENQGVFSHFVEDYSDIPRFLYDITKRAVEAD